MTGTGVRVVHTRRGARLLQGDAVLSEPLRHPGPTHQFCDVLAAAVASLAPGPRLLMLGFAAGGIVAPLRAAGWSGPVEAVDLSDTGIDLFRELSGRWAGRVRLHRDDAVSWTRRRRAPFDVILEDLSVPGPAGTTKPAVTPDPLPGLIARRLGGEGLALFNLLPMPGWTWKALLSVTAAPWGHALVIVSPAYENRLLVASDRLPDARIVGARLRASLRATGSRMARQLSVRTLGR